MCAGLTWPKLAKLCMESNVKCVVAIAVATTATDYRKMDNHECHESHECKTRVSMSFVAVSGLQKTE